MVGECIYDAKAKAVQEICMVKVSLDLPETVFFLVMPAIACYSGGNDRFAVLKI